jgi:hypothetical protein
MENIAVVTEWWILVTCGIAKELVTEELVVDVVYVVRWIVNGV